ncbi:Reverse transcriptase RNA-dependent DNA polymerase, partial [Penicillium mononematosum]|uniref:Reverse transcriptase RNA-dependent DNA polymerase n=1 Tax=Penicillium mononematosum TaxID=268346 RepID=UPI002548B2E2
DKWFAAAQKELQSHLQNGSWKIVDRDANKTKRKPLTLRWVFDIKKDDGRYKARLVARGFNQVKDVDFHEVYSFVAKPMSCKIFCAIAAALGWSFTISTSRPHLECRYQWRHTQSGSISLSQKKFIATLLYQYGMQNCKPVSTPFNEKEPLIPYTGTTSLAACKLYQEQVGKAIWLMVGTRPDISYATIQLAKHARNRGPQHKQAVKRLFRYLAGTVDLLIWYHRDPDQATHDHDQSRTFRDPASFSSLSLHGFCDADYVDPRSTNGISTSGFVFHLAGGPINWASKKQACFALSCTES